MKTASKRASKTAKAPSKTTMKAALVSLTALALAIGVAGCTGSDGLSGAGTWGSETSATAATNSTAGPTANSSTDATATTAASGGGQTVAVASEAQAVSYTDTDLDATWDAASASHITLAGGSARFDGTGATASGSVVTITATGTYVVSGTLDDGQIVVDLAEDDTVKLVLNGVDIACSTSAPIYVKNADKVVITLAEDTENTVTDNDSYVLQAADSDEPGAAIFSKSDLTINGTGSLTVDAGYNNGIASKDDLKIVSGTITVDAVNDALKGRDCIGVKDGGITLTTGGDGLQSTNDVDAERGYICIEGGTLNITAGTDGIQAQTTLLILAGDITLSTGGGSANSSDHVGQPGNTWGEWDQGQPEQVADTATATAGSDLTSAKGLKAAGGVHIQGGTITVDSSDDSIHSDSTVRIDGGTITMSSGDDGIHADATLDVNGGDLEIIRSYEGIESAVITINGGTMRIQAADDGINVAGGADGSSVSGRPGQGAFTINENNQLYVNGGYVAIDAGGDALDCNGRVFMTAGTVLLNGPTNDGNGAIDYMGEFTASGGLLVAAGSSGMAEAPSESSIQHSIMVNFDSALEAGTLVHIEDEDGDDIVTFAPIKRFQSIVLCSPDIEDGATYKVYVGGSSTGTEVDSLYSDGAYTAGSEYATLTVDGPVTVSGTAGGMMGGGGMMPGGGPRPGR